MIYLQADPTLITAQAGDAVQPARISGLAVPWDVVATVSDGTRVQFARGAFDVGQKPAKLIENHDLTQLRGVVDTLVDGNEGLEFEATLADTRASRDAVALLKAGAYDAVSVGAHPIKFTTNPEGVMTVTEAALVELSLVAVPAFKEAVITQVAATVPDPGDEQQEQDTENTEQEHEEMSEAKIEAEPIEVEAGAGYRFVVWNGPTDDYSTVYLLGSGAAHYLVECVSDTRAEDDWLSLAQTIELPELATTG